MTVTIVEPYEIDESQIDKAIELWDVCEDFVLAQEGCISVKFLKSIDASGKFHLVSISEWESQELFDAAFTNPELIKIAVGETNLPRHRGYYETIRHIVVKD